MVQLQGKLDPQTIMTDLLELTVALNDKNKELLELGEVKSLAEMNYRIAKAKEILKLQSRGTKVTVISDLVAGTEEVAYLKLELNKMEVMYENVRENIRSIKDTLSAYQSILRYLADELSGKLKTDY